jgi:uncharacterized membrane protein YsdA (DUF1294 family)
VRIEKQQPMSATMRTANYWLSGMLLALTTALILEGAFALQLLFAWLIAINVFTALFYGIDKLNAVWVGEIQARQALKMRVPEATLLLLALAGGSVAAALAIALLPHKSNKGWFMFRFLLILLVQGFALYLFWDHIPWP